MSKLKPSRHGTKEERGLYEKQLRENNPEFAERQRLNSRNWAGRNVGRKRLLNKEYHDSGRYRIKFLARWGLVIEDQPEGCHICGCLSGDRSLSLDHNHTSGEPRGFLCQQCNIAIGHFKDDKDLLRLALEYLDNPPLAGKGHPKR